MVAALRFEFTELRDRAGLMDLPEDEGDTQEDGDDDGRDAGKGKGKK